MRVIKFRAFVKGEMKYNVGVHPHIACDHTMFEEDDFYFINQKTTKDGHITLFSDDKRLMQFTGLLDRNGKEIYEGDIVKRISFLPPENVEICQIVFTEGSFYSAEGYDEDEEEYIGYQLLTGDLEVIGDIYTTLELLTNKK